MRKTNKCWFFFEYRGILTSRHFICNITIDVASHSGAEGDEEYEWRTLGQCFGGQEVLPGECAATAKVIRNFMSLLERKYGMRKLGSVFRMEVARIRVKIGH